MIRASGIGLRIAETTSRLVLLTLCTLIFSGARAEDSSDVIARGQLIARMGDCAACHTAQDRIALAGGRAISTPFGRLYATNLTPDRETGIGTWSADDFDRAMRRGLGPGGQHLYPAFPYPWFAHVTRDDIDALRAYLVSLPAVKRANRAPELTGPAAWRGVMVIWNALYFRPAEFEADATQSPAWNRGAYLVQGLGHCSACHAEKNLLGAVAPAAPLLGGRVALWYAPELSSDFRAGLGRWSEAELVEYLATGASAAGAAAGPMREVIENSTQYLPRTDLEAIATYLKHPVVQRREAGDQDAWPTPERTQMQLGQALYVDHCTGCHLSAGQGQSSAFPALAGDSALQADDPSSVLAVLLSGGRMAQTAAKPTGLAMPGFGEALSNDEIAALANFIRNQWGNHARVVDAEQVARIRGQLALAGADSHPQALNWPTGRADSRQEATKSP